MSKIKYYFALLRALLPSAYFCFKYLPLKQAIKLPILLYKPHDCIFNGNVHIDAPYIYTGMIRLGFYTSTVYPNTGVVLNIEGTMVFNGSCFMGNETYIVVGKQGRLVFGDDFKATCGTKIICMYRISFSIHTLLGWEVCIIDSNFHPLYNLETKEFKKAYERIEISENNWFAMNCLVLPGVHTPANCVFGARTILTKNAKYESYCVHGGNPIRILCRNVERIIGQDSIIDYK